MANEALNEKLSIKNLLFSKTIPNYVIPVSTVGHKVYSCTDCGDRFIFESSYEQHINRKSVQITYMCRHCCQLQTFVNRCNLLSHIRSHAFKTATINVSDLLVEPLPLNYFKNYCNLTSNDLATPQPVQIPHVENHQKQRTKEMKCVCYDCKKDITNTGIMYKDRAKHFMQYTNEVHACPVCMFVMPTNCALKTHLRIHLRYPPYFCPECGIHLSTKSIHYPYNHDCEGFKMMRVTARSSCPIPECNLIHPNEYKEHLKSKHLIKVYKCSLCVVACFCIPTIEKHLKSHQMESKYLVFYKCEMCPGKLVLENQTDNHLKSHINRFVYPCWNCGMVFKEVTSLIKHHTSKHNDITIMPKNLAQTITNKTVVSNKAKDKSKIMYRVVKRCAKCKHSFVYKCKYDQIRILPNECPNNCALGTSKNKPSVGDTGNNNIKCNLCKSSISQNWEDIKKHFATHHKEHQCIDAQVVIKKIDVDNSTMKIKKGRKLKEKYKHITLRKKTRKNKKCVQHHKPNGDSVTYKLPIVNDSGEYVCNKCTYKCDGKELLEKHMVAHRDPCMAYQCMECGQSFVVKPSFSTHLLLEHGITDVDKYINEKQCYNGDALLKYQQDSNFIEPLGENQCKICREQFEDSHSLEKHFRVHGMAFLMKNTATKTHSP